MPFQSFSSFVFYFPLSSSTQSGRYPDKRVTGLPFTARVGKELELSLLKGSSRTVLHCAH